MEKECADNFPGYYYFYTLYYISLKHKKITFSHDKEWG